MTRTEITAVLCGVALLVGGCARLHEPGATGSPSAVQDKAAAVAAPGLRDGELAVPPGYRNWPVFLAGIDKPDTKQIRDIYINPRGHGAPSGGPFPDGTMSVMEIWAPKLDAAGNLVKGGDGKLVKDALSMVFVMGKSSGAGALVAPELRNGDWVYAGYAADGKSPGGPAVAACRACHLPQVGNDFVFRADEYFARR